MFKFIILLFCFWVQAQDYLILYRGFHFQEGELAQRNHFVRSSDSGINVKSFFADVSKVDKKTFCADIDLLHKKGEFFLKCCKSKKQGVKKYASVMHWIYETYVNNYAQFPEIMRQHTKKHKILGSLTENPFVSASLSVEMALKYAYGTTMPDSKMYIPKLAREEGKKGKTTPVGFLDIFKVPIKDLHKLKAFPVVESFIKGEIDIHSKSLQKNYLYGEEFIFTFDIPECYHLKRLSVDYRCLSTSVLEGKNIGSSYRNRINRQIKEFKNQILVPLMHDLMPEENTTDQRVWFLSRALSQYLDKEKDWHLEGLGARYSKADKSEEKETTRIEKYSKTKDELEEGHNHLMCRVNIPTRLESLDKKLFVVGQSVEKFMRNKKNHYVYQPGEEFFSKEFINYLEEALLNPFLKELIIKDTKNIYGSSFGVFMYEKNSDLEIFENTEHYKNLISILKARKKKLKIIFKRLTHPKNIRALKRIFQNQKKIDFWIDKKYMKTCKRQIKEAKEDAETIMQPGFELYQQGEDAFYQQLDEFKARRGMAAISFDDLLQGFVRAQLVKVSPEKIYKDIIDRLYECLNDDSPLGLGLEEIYEYRKGSDPISDFTIHQYQAAELLTEEFPDFRVDKIVLNCFQETLSRNHIKKILRNDFFDEEAVFDQQESESEEEQENDTEGEKYFPDDYEKVLNKFIVHELKPYLDVHKDFYDKGMRNQLNYNKCLEQRKLIKEEHTASGEEKEFDESLDSSYEEDSEDEKWIQHTAKRRQTPLSGLLEGAPSSKRVNSGRVAQIRKLVNIAPFP